MTIEQCQTIKPWQYSVKLEVNAKGFVQPSIHVYGDDPQKVHEDALASLEYTITGLRQMGYKVATDIKEACK